MSLLKTVRLCVALLSLGGLLQGCGNDDLPRYTALGDLRVLGLIANTPEIAVGGSVNITPIVSDLSLCGRTVNWTAQICDDPGVSFGATPTCSGGTQVYTVATGTNVALTAPRCTEALTAIAVNNATWTAAPTSLASNPAAALLLFNGVAKLFTFDLTATNSAGLIERVRSFRRIFLSTRTPKNTVPPNPVIQTSSGAAVSSVPTTGTTFVISNLGSAAETYNEYNAQGVLVTKTETLAATWFVGEGEFQYFRTAVGDTNSYTPPAASSSSKRVIAVISRDGRGGESFTKVEGP